MKKTLVLTTAIGFSLLSGIVNAGSRIDITNPPPANSTGIATVIVNACTNLKNYSNEVTKVPVSQLSNFASQFNSVGPTVQACPANGKGKPVTNTLTIRFPNGGVCSRVLPLGSPRLVIRFNKAGKYAGCSVTRS